MSFPFNPANFKPSDWTELSSQQFSVIDWGVKDTGSLWLDALAGCGKTYTAMKLIHAIATYGLGEVAIMAFSKPIAGEFKAKIEAAGYHWQTVQGGTCHSFGVKAWYRFAKEAKMDDDKVFNIIKELAAERLREQSYKDPTSLNDFYNIWVAEATLIRRMVEFAKNRALGVGELKYTDREQWWKIFQHHGLEYDVSEDTNVEDVITSAIKVYKISLDRCKQVFDFGDMILAPLYYKVRFFQKDWIIIDEAQDTNRARRLLAFAMLKPTGRLVFIGDKKQAIFGFTGADNDSMEQLFEEAQKRTGKCTVLPLTVTRRCPKAVVAAVNHFVPTFKAWEGAQEGQVRQINYDALFAEGLTKDDAILCRKTAPLISTAYALIAKGIACYVEGREIGNGLIKLASRWKVKTTDQLLEKLQVFQEKQTAKYIEKGQEGRIEILIDQLTCLRIVIDKNAKEGRHLVEDLKRDLTSMFGDTKEGEKPKVLVLATAHRSKGREWKRVFILGRAKWMPSRFAKQQWEIEQEANLEYVAMTRALEQLIDVIAPPEMD